MASSILLLTISFSIFLYSCGSHANLHGTSVSTSQANPSWNYVLPENGSWQEKDVENTSNVTQGRLAFVHRESLRSNRQACPVLIDDDKPVTRLSSPFSFVTGTQNGKFLQDGEFLPSVMNMCSEPSPKTVETSTRIVGGLFASESLRMSAVAFYDPSLTRFVCTGTLLSPRWVLTAAHCQIQEGFLVSLGSTQAFKDGYLFSVTRTFSHPNFKDTEKRTDNDIAVVEILGGALPGSKFMEIYQDANVPIANSRVRALGFGTTSFYSDVPDPAHLALRQVDMTVTPPDLCKAIFSRIKLGMSPRMHVCAGGLRGGCSVCRGDSGGPLLIYKAGQPIIAGITSYAAGDECASPGIPTVFSRVSTYIKWLKSTPAVFYTEAGVFGDDTKKCAFGQYVFSVTSRVNTTISFCRDCPSDQVSIGGSTTSCSICLQGLVRSTVDGRKCTCTGRLARGRGLTNGSCTPCAPGTFSGTDNEVCLLCPPGTFSFREGSSLCSSCPENTFSDTGAAFCKQCSPGTFSGSNASSCH